MGRIRHGLLLCLRIENENLAIFQSQCYSGAVGTLFSNENLVSGPEATINRQVERT